MVEKKEVELQPKLSLGGKKMEIIKDTTTISADVILKNKIRITLFIPNEKLFFVAAQTQDLF